MVKLLILLVVIFCAVCVYLGVVRLQSDAFESELKVWQKERVPSRFDTRLWLYGLHGHVQSEGFRFK